MELKKRKWKGNARCNICNVPKTTDHIFFSCIVAKFLWTCFKEALSWDRIPGGWQDFLDNWIPLGCKDYNAKLFLLTMVTWALWTSRNKRAIEGLFPRYPADLLFKTNALLQKWRVLQRDSVQIKITEWAGQVRRWMETIQEEIGRRPAEDLFL